MVARASRRERVETLLLEALDLPPGERSAFLNEVCDTEERRQADELLQSLGGFDSFLELPVLPALTAGARPSEVQRETIGTCKVLKRLGEGGMGTVYLAEQTAPLRRLVAVKVIRPEMMREEAVVRFESERQALARMNHPNIAQALEAGTTEDGEPFFVMEYVPGQPITRFCDDHRLTIQQRLELFLDVCAGVHHLHQKGVIHRDLKPSNILVATEQGEAVPKIIDFGIAKALDQPLSDGTLLTGERVIGTPAYLSPEALRASPDGLDVDIRSDVYALGVLLYELLTGDVPFETRGENIVRIVQLITSEEAPLPSTRVEALAKEEQSERARLRSTDPGRWIRQIRSDLDWAVRRAVDKERERRYGSAAELADDIRRHFKHEPMRAGPPSTLYRLKKFVRRNSGIVASTSVVAVSLVGGVIARSVQAKRANVEAQRANNEAKTATQVSGFLEELFEVPDPFLARLEPVTAKDILDRGAQKLMGEELVGRPFLRARLMETVGTGYRRLRFLDEAAELLKQAHKIRADFVDERPMDLADSLVSLGMLSWYSGDVEDAGDLFEKSLEIRKKLVAQPDLEVAESLFLVGTIWLYTGRFDSAEEYIEQALAIREECQGEADPSVAACLHHLANIRLMKEDTDAAEELFLRALDIYEQSWGKDSVKFGMTLTNLACCQKAQGDYASAEKNTKRARSIYEASLGAEHPLVATSMGNIAEVYRSQGRFREAGPLYRCALEIFEESQGYKLEYADITSGYATLLRDLGKFQEAEAKYREAVRIFSSVYPPSHPFLLKTLENFAALLRISGKTRELARVEKQLEDAQPAVRTPAP